MTVEGLVLDGLLSLAAGLVSSGVGMVGCQKCVHPLVKEYLREEVHSLVATCRKDFAILHTCS